MKRITLLMLMVAASLISLSAQRSSLYIGATGGVNLSKFKFTSELSELYTSTNSIPGLNGGVTFGMELGNVTLSSGLQYIQKGGEYQTDNFEGDLGTGFFTARERLHFVSVPLLIGYRKFLSDQFGVSVALGPSFNFGISGKLDETIEYFGETDVEETHYIVHFGNSVNDDYKGMQVGFQFSPGLFYAINDRSRLTFNITWDSGLSDAFNPRYKDANTFFDDYRGSALNRTTMFSIGYQRHFSLGDKY
jgi:hypothetical protein